MKTKQNYSIKSCQKIKRSDNLVMNYVKEYTFRSFVDTISAKYSKRKCLSVYNEENDLIRNYKHLAFKIHGVSQYLCNLSIKKGDKIALIADSSPTWITFYLALTSIGAIAVPILPGFTAKEIKFAIEDSSACGVFIQKNKYLEIKDLIKEKGLLLFRAEDMFHIPSNVFTLEEDFLNLPGRDISHTKFNKKSLDSLIVNEDDIASIIYTSGTTGNSKGVVLTHKNILRNADCSTYKYVIKLKPGLKVLSILPIAHILEFTIDNIVMLMHGAHITYLGKTPVPALLFVALKEVRPNIIASVPLLLEKIYKTAVAPLITGDGKLSKAYRNPLARTFVAKIIVKKLLTKLGGRIKVFGIGGAALDKDVELFLHRGAFPYLMGYGLTETSPIIAACSTKKRKQKVGYIGPILKDVDLRIENPNKEGIGEIVVKGPSVTPGYYNNDELNKESYTQDGYYKTGDLGFVKNGYLALRGRSKSVILSSDGENIYPENIESVINNMQFVEESLVLPSDTGLLALIKIDITLMADTLKLNISDAKKEASKYVDSLKTKVNKELGHFNKLSEVKEQIEPLERTSTLKIKRFLYIKDKKDNQ